MASLATQSKTHTHEERGLDVYETPEVAVEALLKVEHIPHHVWEPACGPGAIVKVLRRHGHTVWSSDVAWYGNGQCEMVDFLAREQSHLASEAIVTNPPYRLAQQFVEHALHHTPKVCMLLRLAFLESERRRPILDNGQLARVHVFRNRLPMMHREGWTGPKASSAVPFAWFVWDRFHVGPATLNRVSWEPLPANDNGETA
jgi:hypothetical protein